MILLTKEDTIGHLLEVADEPLQIQIQYTLASSHGERIASVRRAVDWISYEIMKTPQFYHQKSEDELTDVIIKMLIALGLKATHDTQIGGHCDIVLEGRDRFLWIAEAKIHSSYGWLYKGFQQLMTRYTTGLEGQNNGELIIYINQPRVDNVMQAWRDELLEREPGVSVIIEPEHARPLLTMSIHNRTGFRFIVRHVPISIYFQPSG